MRDCGRFIRTFRIRFEFLLFGGIFHPNSAHAARYDALIRAKFPINSDAHLAESGEHALGGSPDYGTTDVFGSYRSTTGAR